MKEMKKVLSYINIFSEFFIKIILLHDYTHARAPHTLHKIKMLNISFLSKYTIFSRSI